MQHPTAAAPLGPVVSSLTSPGSRPSKSSLGRPSTRSQPPACFGNRSAAARGTGPEEDAFCYGELLFVWDGITINTLPSEDGFCGVADLLSLDETQAPDPSNPLGGEPELFIAANGRLWTFNGEDGALHRDLAPGDGDRGGFRWRRFSRNRSFSFFQIDRRRSSRSKPSLPDMARRERATHDECNPRPTDDLLQR